MNILLSGLVIAVLSYTVTLAKIFEPLRMWVAKKNQKAPFLNYWLHCPFCLSYWVSIFFFVIFPEMMTQLVTNGKLNYTVNVLIAVGVSTLFHFVIIRAYNTSSRVIHETKSNKPNDFSKLFD